MMFRMAGSVMSRQIYIRPHSAMSHRVRKSGIGQTAPSFETMRLAGGCDVETDLGPVPAWFL